SSAREVSSSRANTCEPNVPANICPFTKAAVCPNIGRIDTRGSFGMIVRKSAAVLGSAFGIVGCAAIGNSLLPGRTVSKTTTVLAHRGYPEIYPRLQSIRCGTHGWRTLMLMLRLDPRIVTHVRCHDVECRRRNALVASRARASIARGFGR